jgi:hypothetical protein
MGTSDDGAPADAVLEGWWRRMTRGRVSAEADGLYYAGVGERVEKILRLAQAEAAELREAAEREAALIVESAERDAARIRSEAEAGARAMRAGAEEQLANPPVAKPMG